MGDPSHSRVGPEELDDLGGHPLVAVHPLRVSLCLGAPTKRTTGSMQAPKSRSPSTRARMANAAGPNSSWNTTP